MPTEKKSDTDKILTMIQVEMAKVQVGLSGLSKRIDNELTHIVADVRLLKKWALIFAISLLVIGVAAGVNVIEIVRGWRI